MSTTAVERRSMAKRERGRPRSDRDDITVKLDRAIVGKARAVATHKGVTLAEFLSGILQIPVDRAYAAMLRELENEK